MRVRIEGITLQLIEGDIADLDVEAVVNAANQHLQLGSGVAGAIRARGGPAIQEECNEIGFCPVGEAVITGGGKLLAEFVIHAVGPIASDSNADDLLASATHASLALADQHHIRSIAFPAISTGVFGFPMEDCAEIMLGTVIEYLENAETGLETVIFCLYGQDAFEIFAEELARQIE
jgi:O-acetyl-ADP-ribose deacetylase (regulator of RNase III)